MCETIDRREVRHHRRCGSLTPPLAKREHPKAHLSDFRGTLQADAYAGFEQIYEAGSIREAACWAHVRRKFYDLQVAHKSPVAEETLRRADIWCNQVSSALLPVVHFRDIRTGSTLLSKRCVFLSSLANSAAPCTKTPQIWMLSSKSS
jgi:hypothetical protein